MPRFSEIEKVNIRRKLLVEGERLFATQGIRKVTIDDLISAANIAKATFYTFFESKEYLYMDIVQGIQKKIFIALETLLESNTALSGKERVRQVFGMLEQLMRNYPILSRMDPSTVDLISRKVSNERMEMYVQQNVDAAQSLFNHGVRYTCEVKIASMIFQALYQCFMNMQIGDPEEQAIVIDLMLNGIIEKLVID